MYNPCFQIGVKKGRDCFILIKSLITKVYIYIYIAMYMRTSGQITVWSIKVDFRCLGSLHFDYGTSGWLMPIAVRMISKKSYKLESRIPQ